MSRRFKLVLGAVYTLLVAAGLTFGAGQLLGSDRAAAANCIGTCPPFNDMTCKEECQNQNFGSGQCLIGGQCCCTK